MSYNGSASPVVAFSLCVVEHAPEPPAPGSADADSPPRFVLVHEKQVRGWWLPGGGVDAGQTLQEAAVREAEEEAGCAIELTGVLRVEYAHDYGRLRVIWAAAPVEPAAPLKTVADAESRGAEWVTLAETVGRRTPHRRPGLPRGQDPPQISRTKSQLQNLLGAAGRCHARAASVLHPPRGRRPSMPAPARTPRTAGCAGGSRCSGSASWRGPWRRAHGPSRRQTSCAVSGTGRR